MMFIQTRPCEQTKVCFSFTNAHTSTLLATLLGVHVRLIAAKMPLHSAKGRPQRDYTADLGRGCNDFAWEMMPELDGGCGRVVALWADLCAMERHFGAPSRKCSKTLLSSASALPTKWRPSALTQRFLQGVQAPRQALTFPAWHWRMPRLRLFAVD